MFEQWVLTTWTCDCCGITVKTKHRAGGLRAYPKGWYYPEWLVDKGTLKEVCGKCHDTIFAATNAAVQECVES